MEGDHGTLVCRGTGIRRLIFSSDILYPQKSYMLSSGCEDTQIDSHTMLKNYDCKDIYAVGVTLLEYVYF